MVSYDEVLDAGLLGRLSHVVAARYKRTLSGQIEGVFVKNTAPP